MENHFTDYTFQVQESIYYKCAIRAKSYKEAEEILLKKLEAEEPISKYDVSRETGTYAECEQCGAVLYSDFIQEVDCGGHNKCLCYPCLHRFKEERITEI